MDDDAARMAVQGHAEEVLSLSGWAGFADEDIQPVPCRGPDGATAFGVWYTAGSFQLVVPIEQQGDLVERVAHGWGERGYTVSEVTTFPDGGAKATAQTEDGFVELTLGSGEPPAMVLVVVTLCYRHP